MLTTRETPIDIRLRSEESRGALGVIESKVAAEDCGLPLHVHPSFDESFYVLEGKLTFGVGDALFTALPGAFVFAPRGTPHAYANRSSEAARVLIVCTPAGFEGYFERPAAEVSPIPETRIVGPLIERLLEGRIAA